MSTPPSSPVWFITGCSSGFGLSLATLALKAGHKVIATSRNPSSTPDLVSQVEKLGGKWLKLDVISPDATSVLGQAIALYGKIDILVNNAGYALLGAFETLTSVSSFQLRSTRNKAIKEADSPTATPNAVPS
jgi:NAD(P)-dependent dehydrogenase (short-subunit alcohol dehydrogenase family)